MWYQRAFSQLSGLAKARVEKRLKDVEAQAGHSLEVVNLLSLVNVRRDAEYGEWKMDRGALVCNKEYYCRIQLPYQPPEEYDFRIVFTCRDGEDSVTQICAAGTRQFCWVMGGWGRKYCWFDRVGGRGSENPTGKQADKWLNSGQEYTSVVKVRKNGVEAYLNGKLITEWKTDYSDMTLVGWTLKRNDVLGLGTWLGATTFRTIEVTEVTGEGNTLGQGEGGKN